MPGCALNRKADLAWCNLSLVPTSLVHVRLSSESRTSGQKGELDGFHRAHSPPFPPPYHREQMALRLDVHVAAQRHACTWGSVSCKREEGRWE